MEIIFHGQQPWDKVQDNLSQVIQMLHDKYHIHQVREMHLSLSFIDDEGFEIELVDSETKKVYRLMEVFNQQQELLEIRSKPALRLIVDNTTKK